MSLLSIFRLLPRNTLATLIGATILLLFSVSGRASGDLVSDWQKWRGQISSWNLQCDDDLSGVDELNSRHIISDEQHLSVITHFRRGSTEGESAYLVNPDYAAEVARMPGGEWVLKRLVLATEAQYPTTCADFRSADYFSTTFLNPGGVLTALNNANSNGEWKPDGLSCIFRNVPGLNTNQQQFATDVTLTFAPDVQRRPDSVSFNSTPENTVTFSWSSASKDDVPALSQVWINKDTETGTAPVASHRFSEAIINQPIDTQLCRLTAFNLPEPQGLSAKSTWLKWVIGILALGAGVLVWRRLVP